MKLLPNELISGKYYYCYSVNDGFGFYFKFKEYANTNIYSYGYQIMYCKLDESYEYETCKDLFCINTWYNNECDFLEEICLKDIIKYMPDSNPDKKVFLRKIKIKLLLNI